MIGQVSAQKGLVQRPPSDYKLLQARVPAEMASKIKIAARESGLSYSYYLETLLADIASKAGGYFPIVAPSKVTRRG